MVVVAAAELEVVSDFNSQLTCQEGYGVGGEGALLVVFG